MDDKEPLAALVEPVDANQARLIRDPRTTVTRLPTSFLRDALIFRFDWWGPYKIVAGTIGYTRHDNAIYFLAGSAENFDRLIANAKGRSTPTERLSYAMTRLEATRSLPWNISCPGAVRRYETAAGRSTGGAGTRARHARVTRLASCRPTWKRTVRAAGPGICAVRRQSVSRHRADRARRHQQGGADSAGGAHAPAAELSSGRQPVRASPLSSCRE